MQAFNTQELDEIVLNVEESDGPQRYDENEFQITDDGAAGWAMRKIKQARENHAAYKMECEKRKAKLEEAMAEINARLQQSENELAHRVQYFTGALERYYDTLPEERMKKTKTQAQYLLPEGKLVRTRREPALEHDDTTLLAWLKKANAHDLIKVTESPKWADVRKRITTVGARPIDIETGEVVDGVTVIDRPDTFEVKE